MNYDEAYSLIKETYHGYIKIDEDCKISDWQSAKKAYHCQKGFDIDLDEYPGITTTKKDLKTLQDTTGGFIADVCKGGRLSLIELIKDWQQRIYNFFHLVNTEVNREAKQISIFNKTTGDLRTADKFRESYFNKCVDSGQLGN